VTPGDDGHPEGAAGRVVPVYAVTGGRTRSLKGELPVESLVTVTGRTPWQGMQKEYRMILDLADRPVSLMEIGAALHVPLGVARVLVSDLAGADYLAVHEPVATDDDGRPQAALLLRLLEGLRAR
jgi:Protein of unknown function (DUF742)